MTRHAPLWCVYNGDMTTTQTTYTMSVYRHDAAVALTGVYDATILVHRLNGIDGPMFTAENLEGMGSAVEFAERNGFSIDGWPEVRETVCGTAAFYRLIKN